MYAFLTNGKKIAFGEAVFDEDGTGIITHDFDAKTLRLGPDYQILDENGNPIGGGSVSEPANQIVYGTGSGVDSSAALTFEVNQGLHVTRTITEEDAVDGLIQSSLVFSPSGVGFKYAYIGNFVGSLGESADSLVGIGISLGGSPAKTGTAMTGAEIAVAPDSNITDVAGVSVAVTALGTTTNAYGVSVGSVTGATNNYALKTAGGWITFGGLPTASAGLPAGTLWNDSGTIKVAS